jgi:hypothetical protein
MTVSASCAKLQVAVAGPGTRSPELNSLSGLKWTHSGRRSLAIVRCRQDGLTPRVRMVSAESLSRRRISGPSPAKRIIGVSPESSARQKAAQVTFQATAQICLHAPRDSSINLVFPRAARIKSTLLCRSWRNPNQCLVRIGRRSKRAR